jgi:transcription antitermination factor NusA-like protein
MRFIGRVVDIKNFAEILSDMQVEVLRRRESPEEFIKGSLSNPEFFKVYALIDLMYKLDGGNISSVDTPPAHASNVYNVSRKIKTKAYV